MTISLHPMHEQADIVRQFNRFYTVHLGILRGRYLETDYSLSEGRILYELGLNPGSTANALRTTLGLDGGYLSRLLRSLTERALIQGQRAQHDKRSVLLSLTPAGENAVAELNQRASADTVRILEQLGAPQRAELLSAMQRVQALLSMPAQPRGAERCQVVRATTGDLTHARTLLEEYFDVIGVVLRDDEAAIRAFLQEPGSAMWIAYVNDVPAGCVAIHALPAMDGAAECKRLYVGDRFRRRGLAEALMQHLENFAVAAGYTAVYLDTKDDLHAAIKLYRQLGYTDCPRYNDNPQATIFMRKAMTGRAGGTHS